MAIVIQEIATGRRALITQMFTTATKKAAYIHDNYGELKSVAAGRMKIVSLPATLPANIFPAWFRKRRPFIKLVPAEGWKIIEHLED